MAKTATYSLIDSYALSSTSTSITFTSIPQTFTDLVAVVNIIGPATTNVTTLQAQCNNDTSSNYQVVWLSSVWPSSLQTSADTRDALYFHWTASSLGSNRSSVAIINFQEYSTSNKYKHILSRFSANSETSLMGQSWKSQNAITSIKFLTAGSEANWWEVGSTIKLYGIQAYN